MPPLTSLLHTIRIVPQALKMLRSLKEGVLSVAKHQGVVESAKTGFCGGWQDDRPADEIVADIHLQLVQVFSHPPCEAFTQS